MTLAGIVVTLLGFVIALMSLPMTTSVNARLVIVLVGLAVSLGVLCQYQFLATGLAGGQRP